MFTRKNPSIIKSDIELCLSCVDDVEFTNMINQSIASIEKNIKSKVGQANMLKELQTTVDIFLDYFGFTNTVSKYQIEKLEAELEYKYAKAMKNTPSTRKEYLDKKLREFEESQRVEGLVDYCKNNHNNQLANCLYNEVYLNSRNFTPEIKQALVDFGMPVWRFDF